MNMKLFTPHGTHPSPWSGLEGRRLHLSERRYGSFRRSFRLPQTVDAENIEAHLENGILTVVLPKAATAKPRTIEVKA